MTQNQVINEQHRDLINKAKAVHLANSVSKQGFKFGTRFAAIATIIIALGMFIAMT